MKQYSDFQDIYDIILDKVSNEPPLPQKHLLHPRDYVMLYRSVSVDLGRITGKTHWINSRAGINDLTIISSHNQKHLYQQNSGKVISITSNVDQLRGMLFDRIFVDNYSIIDKRLLKAIYDIVIKASKQIIFQIG